MTLLLIAAWIVGYVLAYVMFKREYRKEYDEWLQSDRMIAFVYSLSSWIGVVFIIWCKFIDFIQNDKPAKW